MYWAGKAVTRMGLGRGELAGRVAVVTGAGRGVGRETALALAYLGASVIVADVSYSGAHTVDEIRSSGGSAAAIRTDILRKDNVDRLVRSTRNLFGAADILINNAGASLTPSTAGNDTDGKQVAAANLQGVRLMCEVFFPEMLEGGCGTIVNMVSADGAWCQSGYNALRQGLIELGRSLAVGVGGVEGVRISTLAMGIISKDSEQEVADGGVHHLEPVHDRPDGVGLHPACDGVMPADYAGAAVAYLVCRMAEEYHGKVATGNAVLKRAGLIEDVMTGAEVLSCHHDISVPASDD